MDWGTIATSFVAATFGGWLSTEINRRWSRRTRLQDTYADLVGSVTQIIGLTFDDGKGPSPEFVNVFDRFNVQCAKVLIQDSDEKAEILVSELRAAVVALLMSQRQVDEVPNNETAKTTWKVTQKVVHEKLDALTKYARKKLAQTCL